MHYNLPKGVLIKSENAAKSDKQPSGFLSQILLDLKPVKSSFDYGCGKLRYSKMQLRKTEALCLVDSEVQLSRKQTLYSRNTTVREYVRSSNRLSCYNDSQFNQLQSSFDRGFCINVLSVIPLPKVRSQVLSVIYRHLKPGTSCLFVVQYRNSDFTRMSKLNSARPWLDGFILDSLRGHSFYGLIRPERLVRRLKRHQFEIESVLLNEGSAYVWARR